MYENNDKHSQLERIFGANLRNINESKTSYLLYNGGIEADEDPADYLTPIKGVSIA